MRDLIESLTENLIKSRFFFSSSQTSSGLGLNRSFEMQSSSWGEHASKLSSKLLNCYSLEEIKKSKREVLWYLRSANFTLNSY